MSNARRRIGVLGRVGVRELTRLVLRRLWSSSASFGLRADLNRLPEVRAARIPVRMEPRDPESFIGFEDELSRVSGSDAVDVAHRNAFCAAGVRTLYVAADDSGRPIYAQWLVRHEEQEALHRVTHGFFPQLDEGEALLEGAYSFPSARKQGAMADGMGQLLIRARDAGDRTAFTYVSEENIASLRGCANVGFAPDHVRLAIIRFGVRSIRRVPVDEVRQARWAKGTGPR